MVADQNSDSDDVILLKYVCKKFSQRIVAVFRIDQKKRVTHRGVEWWVTFQTVDDVNLGVFISSNNTPFDTAIAQIETIEIVSHDPTIPSYTYEPCKVYMFTGSCYGHAFLAPLESIQSPAFCIDDAVTVRARLRRVNPVKCGSMKIVRRAPSDDLLDYCIILNNGSGDYISGRCVLYKDGKYAEGMVIKNGAIQSNDLIDLDESMAAMLTRLMSAMEQKKRKSINYSEVNALLKFAKQRYQKNQCESVRLLYGICTALQTDLANKERMETADDKSLVYVVST